MKTNIVKCFSYCMLAVAALSFVSCSSDDSYDVYGNPDNLVYAKANVANTFTTEVIHTPVGDMGEFKASFPVKILHASSGTSVSFELDQSLVDQYNKAKDTNYAALPADILDLTKAVAHIEADTVASKDSVHIAFAEGADLSKLTEAGYVAPLRMKVTAGDGVASEERGIVYVVVTTSTRLMNAGAARSEIPGEEIPVANMASWTITPGSLADFTDNSSYSGSGIDSNTPFVIDMQEVKNVGGIGLQGLYANYGVSWYGINSCKMELSVDGNEWTEAGTASYDEMSSDNNGYQYVVLYGAVQARYIRLTLSARSSWYGGLAELRVFAQ
jgi:hypothetical protein